jgi:hypothetical protein
MFEGEKKKKKKKKLMKLTKFSILIKMAKPENIGSKTQAKPSKNRPIHRLIPGNVHYGRMGLAG